MIKKEDYEHFLGEEISMSLQTGELIKMKLIEVLDLPPAPDSDPSAPHRLNPFILVFHGPSEPRHHSGCVMAKWGTNEPMMLGLYAEKALENTIVYTAIFN
ncbi:DUF6916 family protein [Rubritalea spongiae]